MQGAVHLQTKSVVVYILQYFTFLQALQPEGKLNLLMLCSLLQNCLLFFKRFREQGWALAQSPAHHVNKPSPAVHQVWFGWYWGLGRFPYGITRYVWCTF